jgi:hypothetical protein
MLERLSQKWQQINAPQTPTKPTTEQLLLQFIKRQPIIYAQVLRFQPLDFESFFMLIKSEPGLCHCTRTEITQYLDKQV